MCRAGSSQGMGVLCHGIQRGIQEDELKWLRKFRVHLKTKIAEPKDRQLGPCSIHRHWASVRAAGCKDGHQWLECITGPAEHTRVEQRW